MNLPSPELQRLAVLRAFKRRMPQARESANAPPLNVSPFDDRVSTAHDEAAACDLPEIHADVRRRIRDTIEAVRTGEKKSQVILLAGEPGTGKTHLLRTFQAPDLADQVGYVYVGGSNQWSIKDFQARFLDWTLEALTAPTPSEDRLLLSRVRAIGFRAVDHLMANPVAWSLCRARPGGRGLGRLIGRLRAPSYDRCKELAAARASAVFAALDFARFSQYVCDRFLADRSNLTHRYAVRVLLTYLFPDEEETGVGTREKVLHWFRERADNDYFTRRLGAAEKLDRSFGQSEAVRLLVHLFSPAVSKELSTGRHPEPPRVFLLVFDQAEGRNELFESDADWRDFFAHLSELYNTLPNVVVLFTMTLALRNRLHGLMERQFRDRIRMDEHFILHLPGEEQVLALYRSRVEHWLRDDPTVLEQYRGLSNPYVPFDRERLLETAGQQSVRETLEAFDQAFHAEMGRLVVEPDFDFQFHLNELHEQRTREPQSDFEYTADHLETVLQLLQQAGPWLAAEHGLTLEKVEAETDASPPSLALTFTDPANSAAWVCAYLVRLSFARVQAQVDEAVSWLARKQKARYRLWLVRAQEHRRGTIDPRRADQGFFRAASPEVEARLRGLLHVIGKQTEYQEAGQWADAQKVILRELANTYLAELFREARRQLDALAAGTSPDVPEESVPTNP